LWLAPKGWNHRPPSSAGPYAGLPGTRLFAPRRRRASAWSLSARCLRSWPASPRRLSLGRRTWAATCSARASAVAVRSQRLPDLPQAWRGSGRCQRRRLRQNSETAVGQHAHAEDGRHLGSMALPRPAQKPVDYPDRRAREIRDCRKAGHRGQVNVGEPRRPRSPQQSTGTVARGGASPATTSTRVRAMTLADME